MKSRRLQLTTAILVFLIVWSCVSFLALPWGVDYLYVKSGFYDIHYVNYGFPLVWGVNTLSTIAGPVNEWQVNPSALILDLLLLLGIMLVTVPIVLHAQINKGKNYDLTRTRERITLYQVCERERELNFNPTNQRVIR